MTASRKGLLLTTLAALCLSAQAAPPKNVIAPEMRSAAAMVRSVQVIVPQGEIKADIVDSKVAMATGGGLLMAMIDAGVNSARAKKAEAAAQPVRQGLAGYDADALAQSTTDAALREQPWLGAQPAKVSKDDTLPARLAMLDASPAAQTVFVRYEYGLSPDFSSVVVSASIQIADRETPAKQKPEARLNPRNMPFVQSVRSVQALPNPDKEATANAGRWAENSSALARSALDAAFARVAVLMNRALQATAEDLATWKKVKGNTTLAGHSGKQIEKSETETLLYDGTLISVHTLTQP